MAWSVSYSGNPGTPVSGGIALAGSTPNAIRGTVLTASVAALLLSTLSAPTAPTLLTQDLQGQTVAFSNSSHAPTPDAPNSQGFYFTQGVSAVGISGNVVYRSTTSAIAGFAPIINTSAFAIGGLAAHTGGSGAITAFTDSSATACVGSTNGSETQPPTVYYAATTYWYRVTAVDMNGNESPKSATQRAVLYQNGQVGPALAAYILAHGNDPNGIYTYANFGADFNGGGAANCTAVYNSTNGSPQGGNFCIELTFTGQADGIWLPVLSGPYSTWNFWGGAYAGEQLDLNPSVTTAGGGDITYEAVISGDVHLTPAGGPVQGGNIQNIPALTANTWQTISYLFANNLKDYGASPFTSSVIQYANYKRGLQIHRSDFKLRVDNWLFTGTP